ncbi:hypothetical protein [Candidatus Nanogingivalis gingivitcus]|jgi:hypothetical protein|uniref:Uncharacterized protein n=1 Tax=Candidatus Nanogingivalis gingivitcus TaxID=2171992 RepID=A0ABY0FI74_9BACT|nr:hypothetical protein [Candidatus Nanogingivalis gingivitcus]RYC72663.1 hypothetical protein G6CMJM_00312 [Candidatus Nanogingivalis gingivitcus]
MKANTMCSPASLLDTSSAKLKYNEHEVAYASDIFKRIKEFIAQKNHVTSFELTDMYEKSVLSISFIEAYRLGWKEFDQGDLFEFRRREELSQLYYSEKNGEKTINFVFLKKFKNEKKPKKTREFSCSEKRATTFFEIVKEEVQLAIDSLPDSEVAILNKNIKDGIGYTVYVNLSSYDLTIAQNFKDLKLRYPSIFNEIGIIRTVPSGKNRYKVAVLIFNTQL